jgi:hypothetical protein
MPQHRGYLRNPDDPFMRWPQGLPQGRADAPEFCAPRDSSERLAVLGILTPDEHVAHRRVIRNSWLASTHSTNILTRFILRGLGARVTSLNESITHRDMIFVRAPAAMSRKVGPLLKLMRWLDCATTAWPNARLIGKGDDDTWVHLGGVEHHLSHSLQSLSGAPMVWGLLEAFHWHLGIHRPTGFAGPFSTRGRGLELCRRRHIPATMLVGARAELSYGRVRSAPLDADGGVVGPFYFARGPLQFVSRSLAEAVAANGSWARREAAAALESVNDTTRELTWPWEDVFLGLALAHIDAATASRPTYVSIGEELFTQRWGFCLARSSLVWHMRTKSDAALERIAKAEDWSARHHCTPEFELRCTSREWVGCSGGKHRPASWRSCASRLIPRLIPSPRPNHDDLNSNTTGTPRGASTASPCSAEMVDLLRIYYNRPTGTRCQY